MCYGGTLKRNLQGGMIEDNIRYETTVVEGFKNILPESTNETLLLWLLALLPDFFLFIFHIK